GNGFFKPNISTIVGQLYAPDDPRRDGAFTIFYMGINLGALFAPLICGTLGEKYDWRYGFGAAGFGMLIGLFTYLHGQHKHLGDIGLKPAGGQKKAADGTNIENTPLTLVEKQRLAVIIILTAFSVFFWSAFEQAGSSLTLFADQSVNRQIFGWTVPASYFQSLNPLFIMILAPFFANMWVNLSERGLEPRTPVKFIYGLSFLGSGFVLMILAAYMYKTSGAVSMLWMVAVYLLHTLGELCLSPVGLSTVTKLSPLRFVSVMMGVWLGSSFLANIVGGMFAGDYDNMNKVLFFTIPTCTAFGSAIILWGLSGKLKKWMHGIH
ncbi:MAG: peptide MFS transporter, partial [Elusimicrobiaceae bacterium]|nr:peptide MFS transporter [Elusimicrobiaceae bacterium]